MAAGNVSTSEQNACMHHTRVQAYGLSRLTPILRVACFNVLQFRKKVEDVADLLKAEEEDDKFVVPKLCNFHTSPPVRLHSRCGGRFQLDGV